MHSVYSNRLKCEAGKICLLGFNATSEIIRRAKGATARMLNSHLNSSNLSTNPAENQNRVDDLMNTLLQARHSLQNWENQKTEALIKLDALTYDIRLIGEEKDRAQETADTIRKEMQNEIRVYQHHIENLSDQISLIQIEREGLQNQLNHALTENQQHLKNLSRLQASEVKLQEHLKTGIQNMQSDTELRLTSKFEKAYGEEVQKLKLQVQDLTSQNHLLLNQKNEAEARANQNERELGAIKSHMMSVLRVAEGANPNAGLANPVVRRAEVAVEMPVERPVVEKPVAEKKILETRPAEPKTTEVKRLRAVEIEATSVDEYLKRLGY
jgi:chromosome segregation ATPase